MFTLEDVRNIAVQIERNGEEVYRRAALRASDPEMSKLLERLADEEKHHCQWFENLDAGRELSEGQREMEEVGRTILQEMVGNQSFSLQDDLREADSLEQILTASHVYEKDTILFYEMLSGFIDDAEVLAELETIIAQEREHHEKLARLLKPSSAQ